MATLLKLIILVVAIGAVVFVLRRLRPRLHEQRMRRWERDGLLPEQIDPYAAHRATSDDRDADDEKR